MISDIKDIISHFEKGEMIILIDDEDRENEGDLVISSKHTSLMPANYIIRSSFKAKLTSYAWGK